MTVLVFFGGRSAEHEISIISARMVVQSLDTQKYQVALVGLTPKGEWVSVSKDQLETLETLEGTLPGTDFPRCHLVQTAKQPQLNIDGQSPVSIDAAIPVLHGPYGEDGTIQGYFEVMSIPYVGSGVMASAACMDKIVMKQLMIQNGLKCARFLHLDRYTTDIPFAKVEAELGLPVFVKPANMGSSVGVSKVKTPEEYKQAVALARQYDQRIVIEESISGKELEVAVFDDGKTIHVSDVCEIVPSHEFYSYEAKYKDPEGAQFIVPAKVSDSQKSELQDQARKTFQIFNCRHLARIDFFLTEEGELLLNEPNTLPGCTPISQYPVLWDRAGRSFASLLDSFLAQ